MHFAQLAVRIPEFFLGRLVAEQNVALKGRHNHDVADGVEQQPKIILALTQSLFGTHPFRDILPYG